MRILTCSLLDSTGIHSGTLGREVAVEVLDSHPVLIRVCTVTFFPKKGLFFFNVVDMALLPMAERCSSLGGDEGD